MCALYNADPVHRAVIAMPGLFLFTLYAAFVWASKVAITLLLLLVGFCFLPAGSVRSFIKRAGAICLRC